MGKTNIEETANLAAVRQNVVLYCEPIPDLIKVYGPASIGHVSLALGKCFGWVGPILDRYSLIQPLPGAAPMPRVADIGERLRTAGLEMLNAPSEGELQRTITVLKRQIEVLTEIAKNATEGKR